MAEQERVVYAVEADLSSYSRAFQEATRLARENEKSVAGVAEALQGRLGPAAETAGQRLDQTLQRMQQALSSSRFKLDLSRNIRVDELKAKFDGLAETVREGVLPVSSLSDALSGKLGPAAQQTAERLEMASIAYRSFQASIRNQQIAQLQAGFAGASQSAQGFAGVINRNRFIIQNFGFQIGDLATQIASGGRAMVALTQQGSQMLQAFGVWGSVAGAVAGVAGALAINLMSIAENSKTAANASEALGDVLGDNADSFDTYIEKVTKASAAVREFVIAVSQSAQQQALERQRSNIEDLTGHVTRNVLGSRTALDPLRYSLESGQTSGGIQGILSSAEAVRTTYENVTEAFTKAVTSGKGSSEVIETAKRLGIDFNDEKNQFILQKLSAEADFIAGQKALEEAARTGVVPAAVQSRINSSGSSGDKILNDRKRDLELISDLQKEIANFGDERSDFVAKNLDRLSGQATEEQKKQVEELSNYLFNQKKHIENNKEAVKQRNEILREGAQIEERFGDPLKQSMEMYEHLTMLWKTNAISAEAYGKAIEEVREKTEKLILKDSDDPVAGLGIGFRQYAKDVESLSAIVAKGVTTTLDSLTGAFAQFLTTGKINFQQFAASAIESLSKIVFQAAVLKPLAGALGDLFSPAKESSVAGGGSMGESFLSTNSFFGFHSGTTDLGVGGVMRNVSSSVMAGAPRFHDGLLPNEFPAVLKKGERVYTPEQDAARSSLEVNVYDQAGVDTQITRRPKADGGQGLDILLTRKTNRMMAKGDLGPGLSRYGAKPRLIGRG